MKDLEKNIRDQMEEREIQSSDHAWFKVVEELDQPQKKSYRKLYFIGGLVAGLILFFGFYFFSDRQSNQFEIPNQNNFVDKEILKFPQQKSIVSIKSKGTYSAKIPKQNISINRMILSKTEVFSDSQKISNYAETLLSRVETEIQAENTSPIDEVEILLAEAQSKLNTKEDQQIIAQISAEELLAEVNADIEDESFRTKVWFTIKEKFNEAKSALTKL